MNNAGLTGRQCRGMILFCRQRPLQGIKQLFLLLCGFRSLLVCVFHGEFGSAVHLWIQGHLRRHTFLVVRIRAMHDMQIYDVVIHFIQGKIRGILYELQASHGRSGTHLLALLLRRTCLLAYCSAPLLFQAPYSSSPSTLHRH